MITVRAATADDHAVLLPRTRALNVHEGIQLADAALSASLARLLASPEVGGAWKRVGERAGDYIALEIDSPLFPAAFRPVLFRADDDGRTFRLSWKRPRPRDDRS